MALRELPHNKEAEMSVLGSCFLSTDAATLALENLFLILEMPKSLRLFKTYMKKKLL